jgi:hypothetical protein
MTRYQLGQRDEARKILKRFKEWDDRQQDKAYPELLDLIRETEALLTESNPPVTFAVP